jgi:hypothetical protein
MSGTSDLHHDHLPVDPRLERLLRQSAAAYDLTTEQDARLRSRLGLGAAATDTSPVQPLMTTPSLPRIPANRNEQEQSLATLSDRRPGARRQWIEFALGGAAIVLVAAMLVALFRGDNDEQTLQPGVGPSPEATATIAVTVEPPPEDTLPIRATANGFEVALASAEMAGERESGAPLTLLLQIQDLVPDEPPSTRQFDAPVPFVDYELDGLQMAGEFAGTVRPGGERENPVIDLQVHLRLTGSPSEPVRFTITQLRFTPGSGASGPTLVDGPWTFEFIPVQIAIPTDDPATPTVPDIPTPDDMGVYRDLTIEQAQAIVPFDVLVPAIMPDGLEEPTISVIESPELATGERNDRYCVEMYVELFGDESPRQSVLFMQMNGSGNAPNVPDARTTTITINGVEVNRTTGTNASGDPLLVYWWERDSIHYQLIARTVGDLTPALVEQLLIAILTPAAPTADEMREQLERERAAMTPYPIPNNCAATEWTGPEFRIRQTGAAAYFIDDQGMTLGTTHGLFFTGENVVTWLAEAPLTAGEALTGPSTIVLVSETGQTHEVIHGVALTPTDPRSAAEPAIERAKVAILEFPDDGCWQIRTTWGEHAFSATVYVYPR